MHRFYVIRLSFYDILEVQMQFFRKHILFITFLKLYGPNNNQILRINPFPGT
jgi:hypothetical protein